MNDTSTNISKKGIWKNKYFYIISIFYFFQGFYQSGELLYVFKFLDVNTDKNIQEIGAVISLINMPLFFKMFIGLISDKFPLGKLGRRRPYILFGSIMFIPIFYMISNLNEYNNTWIIYIMIGKTLWVIVDGTLDALTVDITPKDKLGRVQGFVNGGRSIGFAISTLLTAAIGSKFGWDKAILIVGFIASLQVIGAIFLKEPEVKSKSDEEKSNVLKLIKNTLTQSMTWNGIIFLILFVAMGGIYNLSTAYIQQEVVPTDIQYGYFGFSFSICAALGAGITGFYADKIEIKKLVLYIALLYWGLLIPWLWINEGISINYVYLASCCLGLGWGASRVPAFKISMALCPPEIEGFMYSTYMSILNISEYVVAVQIVGFFSSGYMSTIHAFFTLIPLTLLSFIFLRKIKFLDPQNNSEIK